MPTARYPSLSYKEIAATFDSRTSRKISPTPARRTRSRTARRSPRATPRRRSPGEYSQIQYFCLRPGGSRQHESHDAGRILGEKGARGFRLHRFTNCPRAPRVGKAGAFDCHHARQVTGLGGSNPVRDVHAASPIGPGLPRVFRNTAPTHRHPESADRLQSRRSSSPEPPRWAGPGFPGSSGPPIDHARRSTSLSGASATSRSGVSRWSDSGDATAGLRSVSTVLGRSSR